MARRSPARGNTTEQTPEELEAAAAAGEGTDTDAENQEETEDALAEIVERIVPERVATALKIQKPEQAALMGEVCYVFGLNPDPSVKPREVIAHKFDEGDENATPPVPRTVTIVTGGGLKIRYPLDEDTEHRLRLIYGAYRVNRSGEREELPLPGDMTLPRESVDGQVRTGDHVYRTGYLREGGRDEANRRETLRQLRKAGRLGS